MPSDHSTKNPLTALTLFIVLAVMMTVLEFRHRDEQIAMQARTIRNFNEIKALLAALAPDNQ